MHSGIVIIFDPRKGLGSEARDVSLHCVSRI